MRLVGDERGQQWDGRGHFFAAAAEAMRRILVDNARRKQRPKHGGGRQRIDADLDLVVNHVRSVDLLVLDDALTRISATKPTVRSATHCNFV